MYTRHIGAVNGRMTIGAAGEHRLLHLRAAEGAQVGTMMSGVALQAQERLADGQQLVVRRAVRPVAVAAVLGDIGVFVDERSLVFHMTAGADRLGVHPFEVERAGRIVGIVAIGAGHLVFRHRVMGELAEFHLGGEVTGLAQLLLLMTAGLLLRPHVQFMAGEAADVVHGVDVAVPVGEIRR